jgi:uncharacterized protein
LYKIINEKEEERWNLQLESHRKVRRWWLPPLISFLILAIIGLRRHSVYVGWQLTHKERKPIAETPKDYGLSYKNVTFISKDEQIKLKSWGIAPHGQAKMTVIFSHGYDTAATAMGRMVRLRA